MISDQPAAASSDGPDGTEHDPAPSPSITRRRLLASFGVVLALVALFAALIGRDWLNRAEVGAEFQGVRATWTERIEPACPSGHVIRVGDWYVWNDDEDVLDPGVDYLGDLLVVSTPDDPDDLMDVDERFSHMETRFTTTGSEGRKVDVTFRFGPMNAVHLLCV